MFQPKDDDDLHMEDFFCPCVMRWKGLVHQPSQHFLHYLTVQRNDDWTG